MKKFTGREEKMLTRAVAGIVSAGWTFPVSECQVLKLRGCGRKTLELLRQRNMVAALVVTCDEAQKRVDEANNSISWARKTLARGLSERRYWEKFITPNAGLHRTSEAQHSQKG